MTKQVQNKILWQPQPSGFTSLASVALLLILVLSQNADWGSSSLLWWGCVGIFVIVFLLNSNFILTLETNFTLWILVFSGVCVASLAWAVRTSLVISTLKSLIVHLVVLIFVRTAIRSKRDIEQVLKIMLLSAIINIIWLLFTNQTIFEQAGGATETIDRLGTEGSWNANEVGMMAATAMLIALYLSKKTKNLMLRVVYIIVMLLTVFTVLLSGSRKALLMILMGFCGLIFLASKGKRAKAVLLIALAMLCLYYLVMEVQFFYSIIGWRVDGFIASITGVGEVDSSAAVREAYIKDGLRAWKERPLLGFGLDCYRAVNSIRKDMYAHNNYVELLADLGIVGTVIYYSSYVYCMLKLLMKKNKDLLVWLLVIMLLIQAVMDYGCVSYNSLTTKMAIMLMFALASIRRNAIEKDKNIPIDET